MKKDHAPPIAIQVASIFSGLPIEWHAKKTGWYGLVATSSCGCFVRRAPFFVFPGRWFPRRQDNNNR